MKIKQNGFTLIEFLTVMGVISVIAALTLPTISKIKAPDGAVLGRTVEQIELGCQNFIQGYNTDYAAEVSMAESLTGAGYDNFADVAEFAGSVPKTSGGHIYSVSKTRAEISAKNIKVNDNAEIDEVINNEIIIDTNGFDNKPNTDGLDRFYFELRNNGKLIPYGVDTYEKDCPSKDAKSCTARIIKDGYKINYKL